MDKKCASKCCENTVNYGKVYCSKECYNINDNMYTGETLQEYKQRRKNYLEKMKAKRALKKVENNKQ